MEEIKVTTELILSPSTPAWNDAMLIRNLVVAKPEAFQLRCFPGFVRSA